MVFIIENFFSRWSFNAAKWNIRKAWKINPQVIIPDHGCAYSVNRNMSRMENRLLVFIQVLFENDVWWSWHKAVSDNPSLDSPPPHLPECPGPPHVWLPQSLWLLYQRHHMEGGAGATKTSHRAAPWTQWLGYSSCCADMVGLVWSFPVRKEVGANEAS